MPYCGRPRKPRPLTQIRPLISKAETDASKTDSAVLIQTTTSPKTELTARRCTAALLLICFHDELLDDESDSVSDADTSFNIPFMPSEIWMLLFASYNAVIKSLTSKNNVVVS